MAVKLPNHTTDKEALIAAQRLMADNHEGAKVAFQYCRAHQVSIRDVVPADFLAWCKILKLV